MIKGGIFFDMWGNDGKKIIISNSYFENNYAWDGGAIKFDDDDKGPNNITIQNTQFSGNGVGCYPEDICGILSLYNTKTVRMNNIIVKDSYFDLPSGNY